MTQARQGHQGGDSDGSRGIDPGGATGDPAIYDTIDYITVGTLSDSTDFGELTEARYRLTGAAGSGRLCVQGGSEPAGVDTIDYITIGTIGLSLIHI